MVAVALAESHVHLACRDGHRQPCRRSSRRLLLSSVDFSNDGRVPRYWIGTGEVELWT